MYDHHLEKSWSNYRYQNNNYSIAIVRQYDVTKWGYLRNSSRLDKSRQLYIVSRSSLDPLSLEDPWLKKNEPHHRSTRESSSSFVKLNQKQGWEIPAKNRLTKKKQDTLPNVSVPRKRLHSRHRRLLCLILPIERSCTSEFPSPWHYPINQHFNRLLFKVQLP